MKVGFGKETTVSYDIYLKERVSGETIQLPIKHVMTGGTYRADYDEKTGQFTPAAITDAWLNITYNYSHYYYEAADGDERFYGDDSDGGNANLGIRGIYGKTGAETIPMLKDLAERIETKYKHDGEWITNSRTEKIFKDKDGKEIDLIDLFEKHVTEYSTETVEKLINEGPNDDYWIATAANAIKPLYQLLAFAELRPDGVWSGD